MIAVTLPRQQELCPRWVGPRMLLLDPVKVERWKETTANVRIIVK
jgi:hypothetical protein